MPSIPHLREEVKKESHIRIKYYDENWEYHDEVFLMATKARSSSTNMIISTASWFLWTDKSSQEKTPKRNSPISSKRKFEAD